MQGGVKELEVTHQAEESRKRKIWSSSKMSNDNQLLNSKKLFSADSVFSSLENINTL